MNRRGFIKGLTGAAVVATTIPLLLENAFAKKSVTNTAEVPASLNPYAADSIDLTDGFFEYLKFNPNEFDIPYSRTINGHFWVNNRCQQVYRSTERHLSLLCCTKKCKVIYSPELIQDLHEYCDRDTQKEERELRELLFMTVAHEMNTWAKESGAVKYFINKVITTPNIYDLRILDTTPEANPEVFRPRRGILVRFAHITPEILEANNVQVIVR